MMILKPPMIVKSSTMNSILNVLHLQTDPGIGPNKQDMGDETCHHAEKVR